MKCLVCRAFPYIGCDGIVHVTGQDKIQIKVVPRIHALCQFAGKGCFLLAGDYALECRDQADRRDAGQQEKCSGKGEETDGKRIGKKL